MAINVPENLITIEEYEDLAESFHARGKKFDLRNGEIVKKSPSPAWHSNIIVVPAAYIQMHLITRNLPGITTSQTTGFHFSPYHCPEPDVAYVPSMQMLVDEHCISEHWPDLVVEVISNPRNSVEINQLEADRVVWLERGATVWEVWAQDRLVKVFAAAETDAHIEREKLTHAALPGLEIPLDIVFAKLDA